jgi:superfamily II DNA/RNA helicase
MINMEEYEDYMALPEILDQIHKGRRKKKMRNEHHLVHNAKGGWDVKRAGWDVALIHRNTKKEAEAAGRALSRDEKSEFVIHGMNGRIQRKDSHGADSASSRG